MLRRFFFHCEDPTRNMRWPFAVIYSLHFLFDHSLLIVYTLKCIYYQLSTIYLSILTIRSQKTWQAPFRSQDRFKECPSREYQGGVDVAWSTVCCGSCCWSAKFDTVIVIGMGVGGSLKVFTWLLLLLFFVSLWEWIGDELSDRDFLFGTFKKARLSANSGGGVREWYFFGETESVFDEEGEDSNSENRRNMTQWTSFKWIRPRTPLILPLMSTRHFPIFQLI